MPHKTAASLHSELSAAEVLGPFVLLILGLWPFAPQSQRSLRPVRWLFVLGALSLLLSYSVLYWSWPPVGFEASGLVWAAGLLGAVVFFGSAAALLAARAWGSKSMHTPSEHVV